MSAESSEPLIFRPSAASAPEALALKSLRASKPSRTERFLGAAAGLFDAPDVGPVMTLILYVLGAGLAISGASFGVGPDGVAINLNPVNPAVAGALLLTPISLVKLHDLSLKRGTSIYTAFHSTVGKTATRELEEWLDSHGLTLAPRRIAGLQNRSSEDLAFRMGLGRPITNGEIPLIGPNGERLRGSFELLPDGSYALMFTGADELYERTDHA